MDPLPALVAGKSLRAPDGVEVTAPSLGKHSAYAPGDIERTSHGCRNAGCGHEEPADWLGRGAQVQTGVIVL